MLPRDHARKRLTHRLFQNGLSAGQKPSGGTQAIARASKLRNFLLSLPESSEIAHRLAGGVIRELGEITIPRTVRRRQLYQNLVDGTLRFLIGQVGQVEGVYADEEALATNFLARRTAGYGIELAGIVAFRASPVWVLAALADATGAGRYQVAADK